MHKKIPDSYSKREGGNSENSGLVSTIDGSTLLQHCVEEQLWLIYFSMLKLHFHNYIPNKYLFVAFLLKNKGLMKI